MLVLLGVAWGADGTTTATVRGELIWDGELLEEVMAAVLHSRLKISCHSSACRRMQSK